VLANVRLRHVYERFLGVADGLPDPPVFGVFGVIAYAIIANICYTGGWIAELFVRTWMLPADSCSFGLRTFRRGMKFSICLTLFPGVLSWAVFLGDLALVIAFQPIPNPDRREEVSGWHGGREVDY
jgi:hypothetical protein